VLLLIIVVAVVVNNCDGLIDLRDSGRLCDATAVAVSSSSDFVDLVHWYSSFASQQSALSTFAVSLTFLVYRLWDLEKSSKRPVISVIPQYCFSTTLLASMTLRPWHHRLHALTAGETDSKGLFHCLLTEASAYNCPATVRILISFPLPSSACHVYHHHHCYYYYPLLAASFSGQPG